MYIVKLRVFVSHCLQGISLLETSAVQRIDTMARGGSHMANEILESPWKCSRTDDSMMFATFAASKYAPPKINM